MASTHEVIGGDDRGRRAGREARRGLSRAATGLGAALLIGLGVAVVLLVSVMARPGTTSARWILLATSILAVLVVVMAWVIVRDRRRRARTSV